MRARKFFSTRSGGYSDHPYESFNLGDHVGDDQDTVEKNRERLARALHRDRADFIWMEQIHSPTVTVVDEKYRGRTEPVAATDALVTTTKDLALVVLAADCVPLLLSDHNAGVIAAVHAGRLGARNGILLKTIDVMRECGAVPANIHVLIGPAICGSHYEVPIEMAKDVEQYLPGSLCRTEKGTPGVDIRAGLYNQLESLGIRYIDVDPRCTFEDRNFYSYRRDGTTGRHAGIIWLSDDSPDVLNKDSA